TRFRSSKCSSISSAMPSKQWPRASVESSQSPPLEEAMNRSKSAYLTLGPVLRLMSEAGFSNHLSPPRPPAWALASRLAAPSSKPMVARCKPKIAKKAGRSFVSRCRGVPDAPHHEPAGSDDVPFVERLVSPQPLKTERSEIDGAIGAMENEF